MRACLFSGGKDSTLAIHRMHDVGKDVELLITFVSDNAFSYMFHKAAIEFTSSRRRRSG